MSLSIDIKMFINHMKSKCPLDVTFFSLFPLLTYILIYTIIVGTPMVITLNEIQCSVTDTFLLEYHCNINYLMAVFVGQNAISRVERFLMA